MKLCLFFFFFFKSKTLCYNSLTLAELRPTPPGQDVDEGGHIDPRVILPCLKENLQEQQNAISMSFTLKRGRDVYVPCTSASLRAKSVSTSSFSSLSALSRASRAVVKSPLVSSLMTSSRSMLYSDRQTHIAGM